MPGGLFNPARGRWNYKNQQRISQHQSDVSLRKCVEKTALAWCQESETPELVILPLTNMERFLWAITPSVPAQYISKPTVRDWRTCNVEYQPYFLLADLWESFKEWSAYGVGVPLLLNDLDYVVQYYVPYLSAIQIFVDPSKSHADLRRESQENEGRHFVKDSIHISPKMENFSLKDQQTGVKGFSSDDGGSVNSQGYLVFQYLEHDTPFQREPLFGKISELALCYPELKNLRSCDMLPSSWFSVAWYPIYRIPTGPTMKDLEACFLTYHSLCTPLGLGGTVQEKIPLPSFGLSSYKYRECMWASGSSNGQKLVNSLSEAACNWLKALQVQPPDHNFFASRR